MKYYLFIDECGNHDLQNLNPDFPVFTLCGVIVSEAEFIKLQERIGAIKKKFWGDKKIILHSRDIRKCQKGFEVLFDIDVKAEFYKSINSLVESSDFTVITANIQKDKFIKQYGKFHDVYSTALSFIIERTVFYISPLHHLGEIEIAVIAEKRGKKEDNALRDYYEKLRRVGTAYITASRIRYYFKSFNFESKEDNNLGLEFTDIIAYPIARYVIDKERANPSFDVIKNKIYSKNGKVFGLKIFP